jgi:hypothetical protein
MTIRGIYYAVRLGPDKNPAKGTVLHQVPSDGRGGIPPEILDLWRPGEVAVVWGSTQELRQLPEATLAKVRRTRLRRKLQRKLPLLADVLEQRELARRPEFFAGKRTETFEP